MDTNTLASTGNNNEFDQAYQSLAATLRERGIGLNEKLNYISKTLVETLSVSSASVWQLNDEQSELFCLASAISVNERAMNFRGLRFRVNKYPRFFSAVINTRIVASDDAWQDPRTSEFLESILIPQNIKSILSASLTHVDYVNGIIALHAIGECRTWTEAETQFAMAIAELASQLLLLDKVETDQIRNNVLFEDSSSGILILDKMTIIDCNPFAVSLFGANKKEDLLGKSLAEFSPPRQSDEQTDEQITRDIHELTYNQGQTITFTWKHLRLDGSPFSAEVSLSAVDWNNSVYLLARVKDVTARLEAQMLAEQAKLIIDHKNLHDGLTGLPNRNNLHIIIKRQLDELESQRKNAKIVLALFDLYHFKDINDTLGHDLGDRLLQSLALRLKARMPAYAGEVFRLGGDEFAVVFMDSQISDPRQLGGLICSALEAPFEIDDISLETSAGIGIACYPDHGSNSHDLLRLADVAMYAAKSQGEQVAVYDPEIDVHSTRRLSMMSELGTAIRDNQLELHYQPRVNVKTGELGGCEALIRWHHPKLGMVSPAEFIPLAEVTDLIHQLSYWVVDTAMAQAKTWLAEGMRIPVAVNLSARNLSDINLLPNLYTLFKKHDIDVDLIELEITESALMDHPQLAIDNLQKLYDMGIQLAIDDFGTGYSSLSYLKHLPIHVLKIDRSFVSDMTIDEGDHVIVASTVNLAHNFSLQVVAEGVEDAETLDKLAALGCDQAQGYHLARPMPVDVFARWLEDFRKSK